MVTKKKYHCNAKVRDTTKSISDRYLYGEDGCCVHGEGGQGPLQEIGKVHEKK